MPVGSGRTIPPSGQRQKRSASGLSLRDRFADETYIHFARQTDFTNHEGQRIVSAVFPVDSAMEAGAWLERETGMRLTIGHDHARQQPKSWAKSLLPAARFAGRRLMPRRVKRVLHPLWMESGLFDKASKAYDRVDLGPDVETFIADYYAADLGLYRESQGRQSA